VQSELRSRGYKNKKGQPLDVDGVYGPDTAAAIRNVQLQTGGAQSGLIDDSLLLTLGLPLHAQTPAQTPVMPAIPNIPNIPNLPNIPELPDPLARMLPPGEKPAEPSFLDKPISAGSNVKVYQAGLGVIGFGLLAAGLYAATRR
jgi:peptidoglycan hydrolase-like protein with peptidoglycan-binding domain